MNWTPDTIYALTAAAIFATFVAVTIFGALLAVLSANLVRGVGGLALSFLGQAGLYFFLSSPFLALMQILIYIGALCITILFAVMLADPREAKESARRGVWIEAGSFLTAALMGGALIALLLRAHWMPRADPLNAGALPDIGRALLSRFGFAFELISVVLLLAILGAVVVARSGRRPSP